MVRLFGFSSLKVELCCWSLSLTFLTGTIFAYGQTGCGKTWTMQGLTHPPELRGVIPNSFDHIYENIKADPSTEFLVRCSYLEVSHSCAQIEA